MIIPAAEEPYLHRAFDARVEPALQDVAGPRRLERGRGFYHLAIPASGASGFPIQLNVGPQRAWLILAREAVVEFRGETAVAAVEAVERMLTLVRQLAASGSRLRLRKAGGTAYAWQIELRRGRDWYVAHQGRNWLFNYFGRRHETILENVRAAVDTRAR